MLSPYTSHIKKVSTQQGFTPTGKFRIIAAATIKRCTAVLLTGNSEIQSTLFSKRAAMRNSTAGFTLVEMLIAVAIFCIITGVLLFNYNNFNTRLNLDILSHQIAQWVRDTQVSAMSVRSARTDVSRFSGFGLRFDTAAPTSFVYFADLNGDKRYNPPIAPAKCGDALQECEKVVLINKKNRIEKICGSSLGGAQGACPAGLESMTSVDILFLRPNPDACVSGTAGAACRYGRTDITVVSPTLYRRVIQVWTTGQISVQ